MASTPSIYEQIRRDHDRLRVTCAELRALVGTPDLGPAAAAFFDELREHERLEEEILSRPLALRMPGAAIGPQLERQRADLERAAVAVLEAADGPEAATALSELAGQLARHFAYEQERVFPATSYVFSPSAQRRMAEAFARERVAVS